jgi:hypothetical protein
VCATTPILANLACGEDENQGGSTEAQKRVENNTKQSVHRGAETGAKRREASIMQKKIKAESDHISKKLFLLESY